MRWFSSLNLMVLKTLSFSIGKEEEEEEKEKEKEGILNLLEGDERSEMK
jgi:hypothetical protein